MNHDVKQSADTHENVQKPYYDTIGTTNNLNGGFGSGNNTSGGFSASNSGGFSVKRTTSYDNFNSINDFPSNRSKTDKKGLSISVLKLCIHLSILKIQWFLKTIQMQG